MMQGITKTIALLLGVPYFVIISVNMYYGWPSSQEDDDRYLKALHPHRVLKLTYVMLEQLYLLKWFPLWLKWTEFYRKSDGSGKNHAFGRNQNTLDIWKPEPKSSDEKMMKMLKPVVVYVYGGLWGSGDKKMYGLLGQSLANTLECVVCIPNYSIYPKGTVPDMLNDLEDTVQFILSSDLIKSNGGDEHNIVLIGHSAGAHLIAQLVINLASQNKYSSHAEHCNTMEKDCKSSSKVSPEYISETYTDETGTKSLDENSYVGDTLPEESNAPKVNTSQKVPYFRLIHSIRGVIGIGGVYHIMDHYRHESLRGVEDISTMWMAMQGVKNFNNFSPTLMVKKMDRTYVSRLPPFLLIHGTKDGTVPLSSSEIFAEALASVSAPVALKVLVDGGHVELALDMMDAKRKYHDPMIGIIKEWLTSSQIYKHIPE